MWGVGQEGDTFFFPLRSKYALFFTPTPYSVRKAAFSDENDQVSAVKAKINPQTKSTSILLCKSVANNCKNSSNSDRSQEVQSSKPSCHQKNI